MPSPNEPTLTKLDATPRTGVLTAFEPEWTAVIRHLQDSQPFRIAGTDFICGRMEGRDVVVAMSGMSMVNAAMRTQAMIDHFALDELLFSGIAGGLDPTLHVGDVVVPDRWAQSLEVVVGRETPDGVKGPPWLTWTAALPAFGVLLPNSVVVASPARAPSPRVWFAADARLLDLAHAVEPVTLADRSPDGRTLDHRPTVHIGGAAVSSTGFVDNADYRDYLFRTFAARIADMESAAAAQVAYANGLPFLAFRSVSDLAGAAEASNEMDIFMHLAAENALRVLRGFLVSLVAEAPKADVRRGGRPL